MDFRPALDRPYRVRGKLFAGMMVSAMLVFKAIAGYSFVYRLSIGYIAHRAEQG